MLTCLQECLLDYYLNNVMILNADASKSYHCSIRQLIVTMLITVAAHTYPSASLLPPPHCPRICFHTDIWRWWANHSNPPEEACRWIQGWCWCCQGQQYWCGAAGQGGGRDGKFLAFSNAGGEWVMSHGGAVSDCLNSLARLRSIS